MRILHLVSYHLFSGPLPPTVGLAVAQRALGHAVWVAVDTVRGHILDPFEEPAAPHIASYQLAPPVDLALSTQCSPGQYLRDVQRLRRFVADASIDVVHAHQSHDHGLSAWLDKRRATRVRTVHAPRALCGNFARRWLLRRAEGIIVRCRAHRERLERMHHSASQVAVMPGSIDASRFGDPPASARKDARARWGVPPGAKLVGMVALLDGRGQAQLLQAAARYRDMHVLLVGRGRDEARLRAMARQLGIARRVHFAGYLPGRALMRAYAACDAMFLAQAGNDAGARAALEAMAAGVPLLAVAGEALTDLVTPTRGWVAASRDPDDVSIAVAGWLADPQGAAQRAQHARAYVRHRRTFAREAAATLRFYAQL